VSEYSITSVMGAVSMKSKKVLEPFGLQEFYVDGFGNFHLSNGILRYAAFTQQQAPGGRTQSIAVFRVIIPAVGARASIEAAAGALGNGATLHVLR
jgi:hypothetical protein